MSIALVRASNPGYPGRYRAGDRHWENGVEYSVEIIDDPKGGPPLSAREPIDPTTGLSDMTRISKAGLAELKTDEHISVLEGDNAVTSAAAATAVARARQLAADLEQSKLSEQMALDEVAALTAALKTATDRIAELEKANAALKDEAARVADENAGLRVAASAKKVEKPAKADKAEKTDDKAPPVPPAPGDTEPKA